jgi:hypothetical protein
MSPSAQVTLGDQYRAQVLSVISPQPPAGVPTAIVLSAVLAERQRRADLLVTGRAAGQIPAVPAGPRAPETKIGGATVSANRPDNRFTPPS